MTPLVASGGLIPPEVQINPVLNVSLFFGTEVMMMCRGWLPRIIVVFLLLSVTACVMAPEHFQLYGSEQQRWQGVLYPDHERIETTINGRHFQGFYIVSRGTAVTTTPEILFGFPPFMNNMVDISMNSARASMVSEDGMHLSCKFLFQGKRLLGECTGPEGEHYQLVAGDEASGAAAGKATSDE